MKAAATALLLALLLLTCAFALADTAYYASPQGDDNAPGTEDAPMQTLPAVLARMRGERTGEPVTIWLADGIYRLTEPLVLTYRDRSPITFAALPGAIPVITGDLPVSAFTEASLCGQPVWAAAVDVKTLRAVYGETGERQIARWPKAGTLSVLAPSQKTSSMFNSHRSFLANAEELPEALEGAYVRLLHWWRDELSGVRKYAPKTGQITMNRGTSLSIREGDRYWLENVMTAPLAPGEWAFAEGESTLYYAPLSSERLGQTTLYAGNLTRLITLDGKSDVVFRGITFARTAWNIPGRDSSKDFPQAAFDVEAAVYARGGQHITFDRCTFRDMGEGCIRLDTGIKDAAITDCTFGNIGAHAVYIRGRNTRDEEGSTKRIRIENNLIEGYGRHFLNAAAILIIHASDMDVHHNEIHDGAYTAISAGWVWGTGFNATDHLRIQHNLIYDIGQGMLADMGGIYLLGVQKNTVISGNIIHNVHAAEYGGWGIYLDEGASGILVEKNLVYGCSSQGFHQHNGVMNTVRNNVFAYNLLGQVGTSDKRAGGSFLLEGNVLIGQEPYFWRKYEKEKIDIGENLYCTDSALFADLQGGLAIAEDAEFAAVGFTPWPLEAGRR